MKVSNQFKTILSLIVCAVVVTSLLPMGSVAVQAASPNIVISQVYGGGGNSGGVYTNDFIELFNRGATTVSLDGWSVQYASATGTGSFGGTDTQITPLSGSLASGHYLLIEEAAGGNTWASLPTPDITDDSPINMSGTKGKVALADTATSLGCNGGSTPCTPEQLAHIVDLVGWGSADFYEGSAASGTSNSTAVMRINDGCTDTDDNGADFIVVTPDPRNSASPAHFCSGPTDPSGVGAADPSTLFAGDATLLTVTVTPGSNPPSTNLSVTCDLRAIGGYANQAFLDNGLDGDVSAGDDIYSFSTTVAGDTSAGAKNLGCTITDGQGRTGTTTIGLTVLEIIPIGTVNGPVGDTDDGTAHTSPYTGQYVTIQGVIYEKTLQATSGSKPYYGFYIQNTASTQDTDPNTSDGLFVYMYTYDDIQNLGGGYYVPVVGDEVVLTGKISEYYNMTELTSAKLVLPVLQSGVNIDTEVAPVVADPPADLAAANRYWERMQGMRVQVPQDSIVLGGRNVFSPADAEVWVAAPDSTIAQRVDPYTRRAFRDAHPLDDNYDPNVWDGNGYRILMGSLGIKATADDAQALIEPARTFDTVTNAPAGGLNYTYSKYRIEISEQPTLSNGVDPALNDAPQTVDPNLGYTIADYNLENLYDYRDNPFSGCDFEGDSGCSKVAPFLSGITPPFNYVPASDADYQARLNDIALQIINDLHSPDILMLQEVENQDICVVDTGAMLCGSTDNADGKPDVLQDLALKISDLGGPAYDSAFDRDSSDLRGIVPAFMYRTDRVELPAASDTDPVLGSAPAIDYAGAAVPANSEVSNPKTLNAELPDGISACETSWVFPRAPDIALFRVYQDSVGSGRYREVYVVNNHFKSGPNGCVAHRTEQAKYNAAIVKAIETADMNAQVIVGGDLNVYPRPDDPFAPIGQPDSSDQLGALYDPALGLKNLWEILLQDAPESAYSYVYIGMAQTLDQMFIDQSGLGTLTDFRIAHINSDFAADYAGDTARGTSDHDPNVATLDWSPLVSTGGPYRVDQGATVDVSAIGSDPGGGSLTYEWDLDNNGSFETSGQTVSYQAGLAQGTFTIKVRVTASNGLSQTATATVFVNYRTILPIVSR